MDYEIVKLKEIADFNKESIGKNSNYEFINYLDTANITNGAIDTIVRMPIEEAPSRAKRVVHNNDMVYSTVRPNLCHYGILDSPVENMIVSTGFTVISCKDDVNPYYVYNYLTQNDITSQLHSIAENSTSAYPSIKPSDLESIEIKLPKLDIQNKIAKILTDIDKKIKINNEINNNLSKLCNNIFHNYLDKYEDKIENKKIVDIVNKVVTGKTPSTANKEFWDGIIPFITIPDMHNQIFTIKTERNITELGAKSIIPKNSISVSCIATVGLVSINTKESQTNQQINSIVLKNDYDLYFLYEYLSEQEDFMKSIAGGSTTYNINKNTFENIEVPYLPKELLIDFNNVVCNMFEKIKNNQYENEELSQLRDTLLPNLMNGEIDLDSIEI